MCSGDETNVLLVVGPPGSGKRYFVDAVAYRARAGGVPVQVLHIDLEGYEPNNEDRFAKFVKTDDANTTPEPAMRSCSWCANSPKPEADPWRLGFPRCST